MGPARLPRTWSRDEDQVLERLAAKKAADTFAISWKQIALEMAARFPGRRVYDADCCRRRCRSLDVDASGRSWTRQETQTLRIICQDKSSSEIDWDSVAAEMGQIFDGAKKFSADAIRKRYTALTAAAGAAAGKDAPGRDGASKNRVAGDHAAGAKRRRSSTASDAVRPALVLDCTDGEFMPVAKKIDRPAPCRPLKLAAAERDAPIKDAERTASPASVQPGADHGNARPPNGRHDGPRTSSKEVAMPKESAPLHVDETLRVVHGLIKRHTLAIEKLAKLADAGPDALNDLLRAMATDPLSDDDCDVIVQWSITADLKNIAKWLDYAQRCDADDRLRFAIIVPQRTLYMLELVGSGRLAIVPDRVQSEMNRLQMRLKDAFLRWHSPLYRLVADGNS